jgi:hypothetical protein
MPFVGGFQNRLPQPFLALRREEQPLDELPTFGPGSSEQGDDHIAAHHPDWVLAITDLDERPQGLLARLTAEVDRRREQAADGVVCHRPAALP